MGLGLRHSLTAISQSVQWPDRSLPLALSRYSFSANGRFALAAALLDKSVLIQSQSWIVHRYPGSRASVAPAEFTRSAGAAVGTLRRRERSRSAGSKARWPPAHIRS